MSLICRTGWIRPFGKFYTIKWSEHHRGSNTPATVEASAAIGLPSRIVKRDQECTSLNGSYNVNGTIFNLLCDTSWQYYDALHISFTPDFPTCIIGCGTWNINQSRNECIGAQWTNDIYGPTDENLCTYLWTMPNTDKFYVNNTDIAQLQNPPLINATVPFF